jgi:hypothetical protein
VRAAVGSFSCSCFDAGMNWGLFPSPQLTEQTEFIMQLKKHLDSLTKSLIHNKGLPYPLCSYWLVAVHL